MFRFSILNSLRGRYAAVAGALGLAVLAAAFVVERNVTGVQEETAANIGARSFLLQRSRHVRDAVWEARETLAAFLLNPDAETRASVYSAIDRAAHHTRELGAHPWIRDNRRQQIVDSLLKTLDTLRFAATQVMDTRVDPTRQYPTLATARGEMLPQHRAFFTAAALALNEIAATNRDSVHRSKSYQLFVEARHHWHHMIGIFRMYMLNRLGSMDESVLPGQERDIALHYEALIRALDKLDRLAESDALGLQATTSLNRMRRAAVTWNRGLQDIKQVHGQGVWRMDTAATKEHLTPALERVWALLQSLDMSIEKSTVRDVRGMSNVAEQQSRTLWMLTGLALIFIAAGFVALERWILSPIAKVTEALKTEALGGEDHLLPDSTLKETRDLVGAFSEMRKQVHNRQLALEHQALHDALTGLPNRSLLIDRLQQAIYVARRTHRSLALLMMDLDRFKEINDTLGHHVGDRLLQEVGTRLLESLRQADTVARLGGDEFALLLPDTGVDDARYIGSKILSALERVFVLDGHQLYVGASIGIAMYPQHGATAQTLIQRADVAMYVAKRNRLSQAVYNPRDDNHSVGRLALMSDLRTAIDDDALELHFQPKIRLSDRQLTGVEALLRWRHPAYGQIRPDEIVPLAEQTGLIKPLSMWVLNRAVEQAASWRANGLDLNVAINLSVYNLQDAELVGLLRECLDRHGLPPQYLSLEITESAMMSDPVHAVDILSQLHEMGLGLAIDDFGTGFSSLGYLKRLPVEALKVDKSFVIDMYEDENDAVIVRSIIDLAHNLGLEVIAEGVETADTWDLLEILRCDQAQGYFIGRPASAAALETWLYAAEETQDLRQTPAP